MLVRIKQRNRAVHFRNDVVGALDELAGLAFVK